MHPSYRDDLTAAEQRLDHLENARAEREAKALADRRRALEIVRASVVAERPTKAGLRATAKLAGLFFFGRAAFRLAERHPASPSWMPVLFALVLFLIAGALAADFASPLLERRRREKKLAQIDAELTTLAQVAPTRIAPATLEQAQARIAELEAEEHTLQERSDDEAVEATRARL